MILKLEEVKNDEFLKKNNGLYKLYVNEEILAKIKERLNLSNLSNELIEATVYNDILYYCVYVGKCDREDGFYGRIVCNHMRGPASNSTLRRTLIALFGYSEEEVTNFLSDDKICFFEILSIKNRTLILGLEKKAINASIHILNLDDNDFYKNKEYSGSKDILSKLRNK